MSADENKAIVRRLQEEGYTRGNLALVDELLAPDYTYHMVGADRPAKLDREFMKRIVGQLHQAFPDVTAIIEDMLGEGDQVVSRIVVRGTQTGDLPWGPSGTVVRATGRQATGGALIISRLADGKVAEEWEVMDFAKIWQDLGAL